MERPKRELLKIGLFGRGDARKRATKSTSELVSFWLFLGAGFEDYFVPLKLRAFVSR